MQSSYADCKWHLFCRALPTFSSMSQRSMVSSSPVAGCPPCRASGSLEMMDWVSLHHCPQMCSNSCFVTCTRV